MTDPFESRSEVREPDSGGNRPPVDYPATAAAFEAYPRDLAGVQVISPLDRLKGEIQVARDMYRSVQGGEGGVDYARLAGAMAGALENIAFYAEWCTRVEGRIN